MPDKSQNITINYKFNTADVEKATATLNKANQATNQLQQAGAQGASKISQEFQKSNKTILEMQTALTRLKSIIEITSNPAKLKQLSGEYRNVKTQLDAATKSAFGFNRALQEQGTAVTSAANKFGQLYAAARTVLGAAIIRQVADVTLEMAKLAGNTDGVKRAFERAFPDSVGLMNQLKDATKGTVSEFELMQRTLQATNLGVGLKELPVLFEFAAARAQQTGESVDFLVDSIVRGIGRKSTLVLDNLGLAAVRLKEKFGGAALEAQSVGDVTRAVAEIAEEEMKKMGGFVETSAHTVDQLNVAWTRLKTNLSSRIDSSNIIKFFRDAFNGAADLLKTDKQIQIELTKQRASIEFQSLRENQLKETRIESGKAVKQTSQELVNATQDEIRERMKLIEAGQVELLILKQKFDQASHTKNNTTAEINANIKIREQISSQGANLVKNIAFYKETVKLLKAYSDELLKSEDKEKISTGIIERKKEQIKQIQEAIEKTNNLSDLGVGGKLTSQLEIAQAELADLQRAFTEFKIKEFKIEVDNASASLTNFEKVSDRIEAQLKDIAENGVDIVPTPPKSVYTPDTWQLLKDDFEANWRDILSSGIDIQANVLQSLVNNELESFKQRLTNLNSFYDEQMILAGDNERAKQQLRIREERETAKLRNEIAKKEKRAKRTSILIDTAAGIAKAIATYIWPYWLIPAGIAATNGAAQLAVVNRASESFAKGVIDLKGPGTATSDSIPANLSRGESVMTAWETRNAGNVLKEIRAKKLDNQKLREMKQGRAPIPSQPVDTAGIIKAIKEQKHPDIVKASNTVYEVKTYNETYKKRVRSRSMGI